MKFAVAILVVLVAASPLDAYKLPSTGSGALANELQDFVDLLPLHKMIELMKVYAAQDEQFRTLMGYVSHKETKEWIHFIEAEPRLKLLLNYIQENGLDIYYILNMLNKALNIPPIIRKLNAPLPSSNDEITGGLLGFLVDIGQLVPLDQVKTVFEEKRKNSKVFQDLLNEISSPKYAGLYNTIFANKHYKELENLAVSYGLRKNLFKTTVPVFLSAYAIVG